MMRKAVQFTVRGVVYSTGFIALVAIPQFVSQALGAPVYM
ncbi:hypothetical protein GA0061084_3202 [Arthrobacter sp. NIO-1057]|nr:hypothetical protein GA0061084_3202 [Arthrobacter sp. NIO-1057]